MVNFEVTFNELPLSTRRGRGRGVRERLDGVLTLTRNQRIVPMNCYFADVINSFRMAIKVKSCCQKKVLRQAGRMEFIEEIDEKVMRRLKHFVEED